MSVKINPDETVTVTIDEATAEALATLLSVANDDDATGGLGVLYNDLLDAGIDDGAVQTDLIIYEGDDENPFTVSLY